MTARMRRVGDILELHRQPVAIEADAEYRRIGIYSWGKGFLHRPVSPGTEMGSLRYFTFPEAALVLSNIQAWEAAVAVSGPAERDHLASNRFLPYVPIDESQVSVEYLLHYFLSEDGLAALRRASPGTQVRNRTLGQKLFEGIEVPLPDLPEQRRIAAYLNSLSTNTTQLNERQWAKAQLPTAKLPRLLALALKTTDAPAVPLGDLCRNASRLIHPNADRRGASEFVGLEHIESHTGRRLGMRPLSDEKGRKLLFQPNEITYGYLRPYLNKAWIADRIGLCSVEQYVLVPTEGVDPTMLGYVLRSDLVLKEAVSATHSLQLPRLRLDRLMSIQVPDVRRLSNPAEVARLLDGLSAHVMQLASAIRRKSALIDGLLPAARNEVFSALR